VAAVMIVCVDELGVLRDALGFAEEEPGVGPFLAVTDPNHRFWTRRWHALGPVSGHSISERPVA